MAKDGTARGGARIGSGKKKQTTVGADITFLPGVTLTADDDLEPADMPEVSAFMEEAQKNGGKLVAKDVFRETWKYLKKYHAETKVSKQLIEQYAMSVARWIQCEKAISEYGFIAKHPTTGGAIASPYIAMSREYMKQINQCWFQIYQIVRSSGVDSLGAQDDLMEKILNS